MLTLLLGFYLIVATFLFTLGLIVFVKNSALYINRLFFYFVSSLGLWILSNYFSNDFSLPQNAALIANHLALFFSGVAMVVLFRFAALIAEDSFFQRHKHILAIGLPMVAISLTPLAVASIEKQNNVYAIEFGPLAALYFIALALSAIGTFYVLIKGMRRSKGQQRSKLLAIFYSLIVTIVINMITNFVLPVFTGSFALTNIGPVTTVILVVGLSYSIVRHRLFDIRLVIARSLAYLCSWGLLALAYTVVLVNSASFIFGTNIDIDIELFVYIFFGLALVTGLLPIKKYFDKITNRLFYRDAYDPQEFLDELNRVLVIKVDVKPLLEDVVAVIKSQFKSSFVAFNIRETQYIKKRLIGDERAAFNSESIEHIGKLAMHIHQSIIVADELEAADAELKELLQEKNIAIIARLVTTLEYDTEGVGYLMLGPKKSGSPYGRQDIKMLEIIANELVIAIQNALRFEEIEEFNVTLQQKVDDATKQLRRTNEMLKEMDETKDEFISMASHQLRTPLTSVKGYLSMVLEGDAGEVKPMQEKLLNQAFTSSQRMVYLISDLLNVSRLRTGKFVIEPIKANLAEVVQGEVQQLKETAAIRNIKLVYEKPSEFPVLMIDETKIRQVIMNFIDNAIHYSPNEGTITVELKNKQDSVDFTVTDTGMGVPKADQQNLFTKFYRAGNARKARPDGTGLGLFMAKKVIVAQEGGIIFKSKEGEGSTFGFTLSKAKLRPPEAEQAK